MKRKLFAGILAMTIMALSVSGCKRDTTSAPVLHDAFFITNEPSTITAEASEALKITGSIKVGQPGCYLYCNYTDTDIDIEKVETFFTTDNIVPLRINQKSKSELYYNHIIFENSDIGSRTFTVRLKDSTGKISNEIKIPVTIIAAN